MSFQHKLINQYLEYIAHYHHERNHQGKNNKVLFPDFENIQAKRGKVKCKERLGGLLKHYYRDVGT
jgi:putative transposase